MPWFQLTCTSLCFGSCCPYYLLYFSSLFRLVFVLKGKLTCCSDRYGGGGDRFGGGGGSRYGSDRGGDRYSDRSGGVERRNGAPILEKVVQTVIEIVEAAIAMQVVTDMPVPEDLHGMKLASETVQVLMIGLVEALVLMMIVINRTCGGKAMIVFSFGPSMSDLFWLPIEIQRICIQEIAGVVTIRVRFERPMLDEVTRK
jgi:hypothetical protein